jgi:hypothetical protein
MFKTIVPTLIKSIKNNKSESLTNYSNIEIFENLRECHLLIDNPTSDQMKSLLKFKTFSIKTTMINYHDIWIPYWTAQERTQKEFESISHSFIFSLICSENYLPKNKANFHMEFNNGIIKCSNVDFIDLLTPIASKYNIIIDAKINHNHARICSKLTPYFIGLRLEDLPENFNPFRFMADMPNLNNLSIAIKHMDQYIDLNQMNIFLDAVVHPCNRQIYIHVPIYPECIDKLRYFFPKMKSILVISPNINSIPKILGVEITMLDPKTLQIS